MKQRICPLDGKPCEKSCPDRYPNDPRGGCILVAVHDACEDHNTKREEGTTMDIFTTDDPTIIETVLSGEKLKYITTPLDPADAVQLVFESPCAGVNDVLLVKSDGSTVGAFANKRTDDINRTGYIAAIVKLLEKADLRKLRLIWVYVERMTRTN